MGPGSAPLKRLGRDASALNSKMHGRHNDELLKEFFGQSLSLAEIQRMGSEKEALYRELIAPELEIQLVPGSREFLQRHRNVLKAVASNAIGANVDYVLDQAALRQHFELVTNGEQVQYGKPHPEIYLKTAELLRIPKENCIVFEDSQAGIDSALAAGMRVVAINTYRTTLIGQAIQADHFEDTRLNTWIEQNL